MLNKAASGLRPQSAMGATRVHRSTGPLSLGMLNKAARGLRPQSAMGATRVHTATTVHVSAGLLSQACSTRPPTSYSRSLP
jgi:hypothetical protein